jgi:alpha-1,3-glucan synthase
MYAIAILLYLLGNPLFSTEMKLGFLQTAVYIYTFASASGYLYFTLNFGEECSASTQEALFRGGVMQGARQIWLSLLWYCLKFMDPGSKFVTVMSVLMILITITCAILLFLGLPECYRATSPSIPFFWRSLFSRKLVVWFLVSELVSAFWLAGLYGRTFKFLWTLPLTLFEIIGMILFFYVFLWTCLLWVLGSQSQTHSWIVSVFSVGLVSPRWAQLFWVTSSLGTSLAWASQAGTFLSLSLFLWLGMLDSLQQIGFGMMLTQTLTRVHVAGCLMNVQVIGSIVLMISRWLNVKASSLFTNVVLLDGSIWFWVVLMIQFLSSFGFLIFFRREQLSRP